MRTRRNRRADAPDHLVHWNRTVFYMRFLFLALDVLSNAVNVPSLYPAREDGWYRWGMEPWSGSLTADTNHMITLRGNARGYLYSATDRFARHGLSISEMRFTLDVSTVPCGCIAAV